MRVLGIQNSPVEGFGLYWKFLKDRGADFIVCAAYREPLPPLEGFDAVMVGGTPVSVGSIGRHPFLKREVDFLEKAVASGRPCLGICWGGQVLAGILGAEVGPAPQKEIGISRVSLTQEGREDPLFEGFPYRFPVFQWHSEAFHIPSGGRWLARSDECPYQAFRHGLVVGLIFHLELTAQDSLRWSEAYLDELCALGRSADGLAGECHNCGPEIALLAERLMSNFMALL